MHKHASLFITSLAVGLAIPLTTSALYTRQAVDLHNGPKAVESIRATRYQRKHDLSTARKIYAGLKQKGVTGIPEPDINKFEDTVQIYLDAVPSGDVTVDGTPDSDTPLSTNDWRAPKEEVLPAELSEAERRMLRQSSRTGKCWKSLKTFSPGFQALCQSLTKGKEESRTTGIQTDLIRLRLNLRENNESKE